MDLPFKRTRTDRKLRYHCFRNAQAPSLQSFVTSSRGRRAGVVIPHSHTAGQLFVQCVQHQHATRSMSNAETWPAGSHHRLRGNSARPEHRHLSVAYMRRVAVVRPGHISNTDLRRVAQVYWRAVDAGVFARYGRGFDCVCCSQRPHAHYEVSTEATGATTSNVGLEHGYIRGLLNMPDGDLVTHQGLLEGKGAPNYERNQVVPPQRSYIAHFGSHDSFLKDSVFGNVGPDIAISRQSSARELTWLEDLQQRTRLGVALAEQKKVECVIFR
mmetsp:Transcript_36215/g.67530  ORF Transcript_36215/g.67530 Transcript_36215/m.67530 type:complete len:271 (-) Transcript_36215:151-963(-)